MLQLVLERTLLFQFVDFTLSQLEPHLGLLHEDVRCQAQLRPGGELGRSQCHRSLQRQVHPPADLLLRLL